MKKIILSQLFFSFTGFCLFFLLLTMACQRKKIEFVDAIKQCTERKTAKNGYSIPSAKCATGSVFPKFKSSTINNQVIDKHYFKGKISVVNFWFEGCAPCVAEIPGLHQLVKKYGKDKIHYLAISRDSKAEVMAFLEQHPWDFDHISNGESIIEETFKIPWGYPTTFIVDKKGIVVKAISGGRTDSSAVERILNELTPTIDSLLKRG